MRQLSAAYLLMVADKDGVLVPNSDGGDTWYNAVDDYMPRPLVTSEDWRSLCCPSALAGLAKVGLNSSTTSSSRATYGLNSKIKIVADDDKPEEVLNRMAKLIKPSATILLGDTQIQDNWTSMGVQKSNIYAWHRNKTKFSICYFDGHFEVVDETFIKSKKAADIFWQGL